MIRHLKNKLMVLRTDSHMREVAHGTMLAFVLKVAGSGLAFAFNVVVARLLGADGAGLYFLALAITTIASVIGRVGLDSALLRFVSTHATHQDWSGVKGVYILGMRVVVVASTVVTLSIFISAPWLATAIFKKPDIAVPLGWMAMSIMPLSILALQTESLKGLKRIRDAMVVQVVAIPLLGLMLIVPLAHAYGVVGASVAYLVSVLFATIFGIMAWRGATSTFCIEAALFSFKELWSSCKHMYLVALMNQALLPFAPILFLGFWASSDDIGIFGAASRVAMLVSFILVTANSVVAPKFAELYAKGDIEQLGQVARRSAMLTTLFALPLFLALIMGGHRVMALFGTQFQAGTTVLTILLVGQFVNVACGSVGYLLTMTGNEKVNARLTLLSGITLIVLSVALIPDFGSIGAAIASSVGLIVFNLAAFVMAGHLLKIKMAWFKI
ncbi:MAG: oligosaccharide flippase family protein [Gallionella sp.]